MDRFPRFPSSSHGLFVLCLATLAVIRWLGDVSANRDVLIRRWHGLEAVARESPRAVGLAGFCGWFVAWWLLGHFKDSYSVSKKSSLNYIRLDS